MLFNSSYWVLASTAHELMIGVVLETTRTLTWVIYVRHSLQRYLYKRVLRSIRSLMTLMCEAQRSHHHTQFIVYHTVTQYNDTETNYRCAALHALHSKCCDSLHDY